MFCINDKNNDKDGKYSMNDEKNSINITKERLNVNVTNRRRIEPQRS